MSGRHRRSRTTPARRALLGTVPLLGGAGLATALMGGASPVAPTAVAASLPGAQSAPGSTASETLPGGGESAMEVVAGARDAVRARNAANTRSFERVVTVAGQLRAQAAERAERARAAGDAALAAYFEQEAAQERSSRAVVPAVAPPHTTDDATDAGADCTAGDVLRLGPLMLTGPECDSDPWVTEQRRDLADD